jgi:hypothetical protein
MSWKLSYIPAACAAPSTVVNTWPMLRQSMACDVSLEYPYGVAENDFSGLGVTLPNSTLDFLQIRHVSNICSCL